MRMITVKIIGLGGIGSILSDKVSRYFNYSSKDNEIKVVLIDGDDYELKNMERQDFTRMGNKAESKMLELQNKFNNIEFESVCHYIDPDNVGRVIDENDIVFVAVDNHKTRKIISDYVSNKMQNVVVISGGNELTDGNVQRFVRKGGVNITPRLTDYHPEIDNPVDKLPTEMSCEELSHSEPQLYFTNLTVATYMCQMLHNTINGNFDVSEVYFDISGMNSDSKIRKPVD